MIRRENNVKVKDFFPRDIGAIFVDEFNVIGGNAYTSLQEFIAQEGERVIIDIRARCKGYYLINDIELA